MVYRSGPRHRCFVSYHHEDEREVQEFIREFDHQRDALIARGIGAGMPGDIIESNNEDYIKTRIREKFLRDTTVTIVLVGRCTWARKFVDWEIAASLRNTSTARQSGLLAIALPSIAEDRSVKLPTRLVDNLNGQEGYAQWWSYPNSPAQLSSMVEEAYLNRELKAELASNGRQLMKFNGDCQWF